MLVRSWRPTPVHARNAIRSQLNSSPPHPPPPVVCPVSSCRHAARRTGCGVQLRVSTTAAPVNATAPPSPSSRHNAPGGPATPTDPAPCQGTNLYYPALLSDALEFLGAGLCWRLGKASSALRLVPRECGVGEEAEGSVTGGSANGERVGGERGAAPVVAGGTAGGVWPLQGPSDPAELLVAHVLRIDVGTMGALSARQVGRREGGEQGGEVCLYPVAGVRCCWCRKGSFCGVLLTGCGEQCQKSTPSAGRLV